jgi:hypothetical protein
MRRVTPSCTVATRIAVGLAAAVAAVPLVGAAHFVLVEPASWIVESRLGDPQKTAPCGAVVPGDGTPTNAIADARGGGSLRITVRETVFHPGYYRVALAVHSRDELPREAESRVQQVDGVPRSIMAVMPATPSPPLLADGLWPHLEERFFEPWQADVMLPNITCARCTLQVTQVMADEGSSYYHCADLRITADPAKPIDAGWPPQPGRGR